MSALDWGLFAAYLIAIVAIGVRSARGSHSTQGFFVAGRSMPWWVVGLSVMATQASAITLIGTTGKAYGDGMRFVQFYFGLPLAMLILAFTLLPLYHRAGVYTAYELLGQRFDGKTRLLSSLVFLVQRSLSLGVVVYAPSIVLSMLLGWSLASTVLLMSVVAVGYTVLGGIRAVMWTDVVQMLLIFVGLAVCAAAMLARLPAGAGFGDALELARLTDRLRMIDLSFDPSDRYTVWSGLVGGTLLFLAYFGCDQSQVQRFLSGRSLRDNRLGLLLNALLKVPVQLGVLFVGVLLFVVFHFERPPLLFDSGVQQRIEASPLSDDFAALDAEHARALEQRERAARAVWQAEDETARALAVQDYERGQGAVVAVRERATGLATRLEPDYDDTNSVFPFFVLNYLPIGLAGLLLAAIFAAAMSSIDSEITALSTTLVVDLYRVHVRPDADDAHYVLISRVFTVVWGAVAAAFALYAAALGSVIEAVNIVGSYFYGSLLGVFVLAFATKRANGNGAFWGLLAGMGTVALADRWLDVAWLWLNPIGAGATIGVGMLVSLATGRASARPAT